MKSGLDILLETPGKYRNKRAGLLVNQTSVNLKMEYSWKCLHDAGITVKRVFSPEHGVFATEQDQISVNEQPFTGFDMVSLYGSDVQSLVPDTACLDDLDIVFFDIQDVGARYYTYVNTMALFMEVLSGRGIEFCVLDRPNPLGGREVEGPLLEENYRSFVGIFPVTVRHGLTSGELALLYKKTMNLDLKLTVLKMQGWKRTGMFTDTGRIWIPPSPNMPLVETALVYPGMCLLEGTNISEGRGTTLPFLTIGAPWIEPERLAETLNGLLLGGVYFRPVYYKPTFSKYIGEICGGVSIHVLDRGVFKPFRTGVTLVKAVRDLHPDHFTFTRDAYEFNDVHPAFDLLTGSSTIRRMIENDKGYDDLYGSWESQEASFRKISQDLYIYQ